MFLTRKFYNTDVAEPAGGGNEEPVVQEAAPMSIAEAMAKHGTKSDENSKVAKPIDIGTLTTQKAEEPTPAATAKVEEPAKVVEEVPKNEPVIEPTKEEPAPIAQKETPKEVTLEEVLKKNQPDTILKALGFDDDKIGLVESLKEVDPKVVAIIQAYQNGNLGDYVNALGTDYTKMSDVEVMRNQLRKEYPTVSEAAFQALFEDEVLDRYKLDEDSYSESETAKGKLLLEAKAARYRAELISNQEKFLMPTKPEPKQPTVPDNSAEQKAKENVETYVRTLTEDPYTKNIIADKKITLGEGETKFSFPVDPKNLISVLSDGEKWAATMYDKETGALKTEHQLLIATVAEYGMDFLNAYAIHMKGLGSKEVTDPLENARPPENSTSAKSEKTPTTTAGAMATQGRRVDPVT